MPVNTLLTRNFHITHAKLFVDSIAVDNNSMYFAIGRTRSWAGVSEDPELILPRLEYIDYQAWDFFDAMKKIQPNDITHVAPRIDWTSGTIYEQWSSNNDLMFSNNYYVVTDEFNVYKCLYNHRESQSTIKPTGTQTGTINTTDDYIWKFLYTISPSDQFRFVTTTHIPVKTLTADDGSAQYQVQTAAVNGAIQVIDVDSQGDGYLTVFGNAVSGNTTSVSLPTDAIQTDKIYTGSSLYITQGPGSGQLVDVINYQSSGRIAFISPSFTVAPTDQSVVRVGPKITIRGDGENATAFANVVNTTTNSAGNTINKITVINSGLGYSQANVYITANTSYGAGANAVVMISPHDGHGADPIYELPSGSAMVTVRFERDEGASLYTDNDFRIIGLIDKPKLASDDSVATSGFYRLNKHLDVSAINPPDGFTNGETIIGLNASSVQTSNAVMVNYSNNNLALTNGFIYLTEDDHETEFSLTDTIRGLSSGATASIDAIGDTTIRRYSGKIIHLEHRDPVQRSENQFENIKVVFDF